MTDKPTFLDGIAQILRENGLTAAITALIGGGLLTIGSVVWSVADKRGR